MTRLKLPKGITQRDIARDCKKHYNTVNAYFMGDSIEQESVKAIEKAIKKHSNKQAA